MCPIPFKYISHKYEKEFISYILTVNTNISYSLKHIFRFQDNLIVFEDDDVFTRISGNIYPAEIVLKNTNISQNEVNYLVLNITICDINGNMFINHMIKGMILNIKL